MDGKHVISTPKLFNSIEYDSIMKQSYFTYYEKDNESKTDISASVDVLIDAIDKAEKNSELIGICNPGVFFLLLIYSFSV